MEQGNPGRLIPVIRSSHSPTPIVSAGKYLLLSLIVLVASYVLWGRVGANNYLITVIGLIGVAIFTVISFKSLLVPFFLLLLSVGGFRTIWSIQTPLLPDFYLDRIMLVWLFLIFIIKLFAEGRLPLRPWRLDLLIFAHGVYILVRVLTVNVENFNMWVTSVMIPYTIYFFAKNIIRNKRDIQMLLAVLLGLSIYYNITSIAEKFDINWLLWPRYMVIPHELFSERSCGPIRNPGIFGNALGMLLPLHLYFIVKAKNLPLRILLAVSMMMGLAGLYFTYTRGSWIAGLVGIGTVALLNMRQYLRLMAPMTVFLPLAAVLVLGIGQDTVMQKRLENEETIGARVGTQITAMRVFRDYPLLGCGSFDYARVRDNYIDPVEVPLLGTIRFKQFRRNSAHDMYLGPLAEDGLVGMGLLMAIYATFIGTLLRKYRWRHHGDEFAILVIPLLAGIAANYLFGGLTISYRHTTILGTLFFMAAGIVDGYRPEEQEPSTEPAYSPEGERT